MKLNKPNHIGIVVENIEEAKERYSRLMGIKKWYRLASPSPITLLYKGENRQSNVTLYFGGKGATKLELIETKGESNIYTEFLKKHGEGIHHIMYNVKSLSKAISECEKEGLKVLQSSSFKSAGSIISYAYVGRSEDSVIFELIETDIGFGLKKGDMPFEMLLGSLSGNYKRVK